MKQQVHTGMSQQEQFEKHHQHQGITVNVDKLKDVTSFKYLGATCLRKVPVPLRAMATAAIVSLSKLWTSSSIASIPSPGYTSPS
ncbi:hypothetical protein DPMN_089552 [Dreissena polymorpha]|uniref:Uncharacterized protein n=1 Tax=Dreissena polymorpha TaxID=45954 RepID=A0A9D4KX82_DREPO|nr:hypothetical protein DPMN_089552 [Dreissena polymorpha]